MELRPRNTTLSDDHHEERQTMKLRPRNTPFLTDDYPAQMGYFQHDDKRIKDSLFINTQEKLYVKACFSKGISDKKDESIFVLATPREKTNETKYDCLNIFKNLKFTIFKISLEKEVLLIVNKWKDKLNLNFEIVYSFTSIDTKSNNEHKIPCKQHKLDEWQYLMDSAVKTKVMKVPWNVTRKSSSDGGIPTPQGKEIHDEICKAAKLDHSEPAYIVSQSIARLVNILSELARKHAFDTLILHGVHGRNGSRMYFVRDVYAVMVILKGEEEIKRRLFKNQSIKKNRILKNENKPPPQQNEIKPQQKQKIRQHPHQKEYRPCAEHLWIVALEHFLQNAEKQHKHKVLIYTNFSPCPTCSKSLQEFSNECKLTIEKMEIVIGALYKIQRPYCRKKDHTHQIPTDEQHKKSAEELQKILKDEWFVVRPFRKADFVKLAEILKLTINPKMSRNIKKRNKDDIGYKWDLEEISQRQTGTRNCRKRPGTNNTGSSVEPGAKKPRR